MSKAIILYNYNKYYNRIIKRLDTFAEYQALITSIDGTTPPQHRGLLRENFNFDFADGVHASKVLNINKNEETFFKSEHPDYIVIEEEYNAGTLEEPLITTKLTRWFVLDISKQRGLQYVLSLRRDLLADYYNEVLSAPAFIERGNPIIDDPAIFNKEGFTFNQIKKHELLLNNTKLSGRGGGWIVGYLARSTDTQAINATGHQELPPAALIPDYDNLPQGLKDLIANGFGFKKLYKWYTYLKFYYGPNWYPSGNESNSRITESGEFITSVSVGNSSYTGNAKTINFINVSLSDARIIIKNQYELLDATSNSIRSKIDDWYNSLNLQNRFTGYEEYNNMIIKKDGKIYKIRFDKVGSENIHYIDFNEAQIEAGSSALAVAFKKLLENIINVGSNITREFPQSSEKVVRFAKPEQEYNIYLEEIDFQEIKTTIPATRNENLEAPYDLFCIPMGELDVKLSGSTLFTTQVNSALAIARGISVAGAGNVYDIQVLPYCPYPDILTSEGDIDLSGYEEDKDYCYIKQSVGGQDYNMGVILFPRSCRGTFDLTIPTTFEGYEEYCVEDTTSALSKKIKSETQLARFVSPNFSAVFEINVQKNEGISEINVDYFLKPYSPYIHVAPYFSGLYGEDYNDPKGLICSGDFSITATQNQWEAYQVQNKNYELIFNRQIENLDVNNAIAYEQQEITGTLGAVSSAIQGATAGAMIGALTMNPFVAAAGAVAGGLAQGITSGYGAKKDLEFLARSQQETRSFSKDMFTYQLGNIKALPNTLTKVSSFTENNKIFPFIEFYDCTDEEKEALRDKVVYNGMTVMRIGTIQRFIDGDRNYVQAQLIRLLGLNEDNHVVSELAKEIGMGAYYYGTNTSES